MTAFCDEIDDPLIGRRVERTKINFCQKILQKFDFEAAVNYISDNYNEVSFLDKKDLLVFKKALNIVFDDLRIKSNGHHLRVRPKRELVDHFNSGMPILGIRRNGAVVATALLCFPDRYKVSKAKKKALAGYPLSHFSPDSVSVIQGISVLPRMRSKGLAKILFEKAAKISIINDRPNMIAKVDAGNQESLDMFNRLGFECYNIQYNPKNRKTDIYLHGDAGSVWTELQFGKCSLFKTRHRSTILK